MLRDRACLVAVFIGVNTNQDTFLSLIENHFSFYEARSSSACLRFQWTVWDPRHKFLAFDEGRFWENLQIGMLWTLRGWSYISNSNSVEIFDICHVKEWLCCRLTLCTSPLDLFLRHVPCWNGWVKQGDEGDFVCPVTSDPFLAISIYPATMVYMKMNWRSRKSLWKYPSLQHCIKSILPPPTKTLSAAFNSLVSKKEFQLFVHIHVISHKDKSLDGATDNHGA